MDSRRFFKTVFYLIFFSLCLGSIYREFSGWFKPAWFTVLCINTILAVLVFLLPYRPDPVGLWKQFQEGRLTRALKSIELRSPHVLYIPAIVIFLGSIFLPLASSLFINLDVSRPFSYNPLILVIWVPIVEELLFRRGFGLAFRAWSGPIWGGYFSAIFFAVAHAQPTFQSIITDGIGISLGPLLLGICVEFLYSLGQYRLGPCIALHAACNFSAVAFQMIDPRWLEWLSFFYI